MMAKQTGTQAKHYQCLEDLHRSLQALGSRLYVLQGPYQGTVMRLVAQWGITQLSMDTEIEPHYTQLDQQHRIMARTCPSPAAEEYSEGDYRAPSGWVANFSKPRTIPNSLLPSTTGLSPYLSLGCLSVWAFYHKLSKIYAQSKNHSLPPVSLQGQVLWREFFYTVASATANFIKKEGNSICL
ncbi:unnamed protein product [Coregonus sp. 'balchen']|nr:unnamed protein product [Coregonus sp. 'balchen']